jgi:phage tail sheath protein FI
MAYKHGAFASEVPTKVVPSVSVFAGLPVVFGCAPLNMATASAGVNKPTLCYTQAEAVAAFGFVPANPVTGKFDFEISEAIDTHFSKFNVAPLVLINVLDPAEHKTAVPDVTVTLAGGFANIAHVGVLKDTVVVSAGGVGGDVHPESAYVLTFNQDGTLRITAVDGGPIVANAQLKLTFSKLDPALVEDADIIGGIDVNTNKRTGLELVAEVYPRFRLVPGSIVCPGRSGSSAVAAVMRAKTANINGVFKAIALIDIPSDTVTKYADAPAWKNDNKYHLSMQAASLMCQVDAERGDGVPYVSPSNKNIQADGLCTADGTEVVLGLEEGAYLNGQGIVTGLNFNNGWVLWGGQTATYPGNTDVKDADLAIRRMFTWVGNTLILTHFVRVDNPLNDVQVSTVRDSANIWLNGLTARSQLLGGKVDFLPMDNPTTDLMAGIARWRVRLTPPSTNREMQFILEYDITNLQALFAA